MRAITRPIVLVASFVITVCFAPVAAAETVALPEGPRASGVAFVDNPAIVDSHPIRPDSWSRVAGDRAVALNFYTGTPECYGVHATVAETADTVTVELRGGALPEASGRACIMIAVSGTLNVPLQAPLGSRQVLSTY